MKYVFIEKYRAEFRIRIRIRIRICIRTLCRVLHVARSGWYRWCQRRGKVTSRMIFRQRCDTAVRDCFFSAKQRYGALRLTDELHDNGICYNRNRNRHKSPSAG